MKENLFSPMASTLNLLGLCIVVGLAIAYAVFIWQHYRDHDDPSRSRLSHQSTISVGVLGGLVLFAVGMMATTWL